MVTKKKYYLYHWKPRYFEGETIYPLNDLKEKYPAKYEHFVKNYEGREGLLARIIPALNCLWNDVIHLTAVHPKIVRKALIETGNPQPPWESFEIDPTELDSSKLIVYLYPANDTIPPSPQSYERFDITKMKQYEKLPNATKEYYHEMATRGKKPLIYHLVPHILYQGSISVKGKKIIYSK